MLSGKRGENDCKRFCLMNQRNWAHEWVEALITLVGLLAVGFFASDSKMSSGVIFDLNQGKKMSSLWT